MTGYAFAVGTCIALVAFLVVLLRTRRLREKYAFLWIAVSLAVCLLGAFPDVAGHLARLVGVQTPSNLVFALALVVLLLVCVQLSTEVTSLEEETRTLVEEVALLRLDVERALGRDGVPPGPVAEPTEPSVAEPSLADPSVAERPPDVERSPDA
jgi:hypothetical protein